MGKCGHAGPPQKIVLSSYVYIYPRSRTTIVLPRVVHYKARSTVLKIVFDFQGIYIYTLRNMWVFVLPSAATPPSREADHLQSIVFGKP